MHVHISKTKKFITIGTILFLSGCDNTNQMDSDSEQEQATISAQNAIYSTVYSDSYEVDLSDHVSVSGSDTFFVSSVEPLSALAECQVNSITQTGFTISASASKACDYEYEVALGDKLQSSESDSGVSIDSMDESISDSAITRVAITKEEEGSVQLSPISSTTLIEQNVVVDVKQQLQLQTGYIVESDFTLSTDVTLPYSSATAIADPIDDTISYTPTAGFEGVERVLYSYVNDVTGEVLLGSLDIAVAYQANQGLEVQSRIYHPAVEIDVLETIDVAEYVTSLDGDDFQLIYVDSYFAAVDFADPSDIYNTSFTFYSTDMRYNYVSFAVTDHKGSYGFGMMMVPSYDSTNVSQWDNIQYENLSYLKPLTTTEAMGQNIVRSGYIEDFSYSPPVSISLHTWTQTEQCNSVGRVPTVSEMQELQSSNIKVTNNWPTTTLYWADDDGTPKTIDMTTGEVADAIGTEYMMTCIISSGLTSEVTKEEAVANLTDSAVINFNYTEQVDNTVDVVNVPNELVTITTNSGTAVAASGVTDEYGNFAANVFNTTAEDVEVCGQAGITILCSTVSFIADAGTAEISETSLNTKDWMPGDDSTYNLYVEVSDAYGNLVNSALTTSVKILDAYDDASLTIVEEDAVTNIDGIATASVINTENNTDNTDYTEIEVSHTNTSGETSSMIESTIWGSWQWQTPLEVKVLLAKGVGSCSGEYGEGWRIMSGSERDEYSDEISNHITLQSQDPIFIAIDEHFAAGNTIATTLSSNMWFYDDDGEFYDVYGLNLTEHYDNTGYRERVNWPDPNSEWKIEGFASNPIQTSGVELNTLCVKEI